MDHIVYRKSYEPYHMDHIIWTVSYGSYHMDHIIWIISYGSHHMYQLIRTIWYGHMCSWKDRFQTFQIHDFSKYASAHIMDNIMRHNGIKRSFDLRQFVFNSKMHVSLFSRDLSKYNFYNHCSD